MPEFNELWTGGPFFAQAEHFRLSTDSVLLADFANINGAKRGIDLGCASGIAALLLLCRAEKLHMTGLEIVPAAAELARENMERNGLGGRSEMLCGDIRDHRSLSAPAPLTSSRRTRRTSRWAAARSLPTGTGRGRAARRAVRSRTCARRRHICAAPGGASAWSTGRSVSRTRCAACAPPHLNPSVCASCATALTARRASSLSRGGGEGDPASRSKKASSYGSRTAARRTRS